MGRAGVFVGVDQTGTLQRLNDAARGARRMYEWALSQGMVDKTHAKLITDADGGKVIPDHIYDAIKEIIEGPGVDQLILYFAGHGVNINRNEHWLLTEAPTKTSAAVDVTGSVELARYCGIQHVVIISDACRVAPEGIQAQNVRGVDVFPNVDGGDKSKPVDQFFACYLGRTATELKDPKAAAATYSALYTTALLDALQGKRFEVLEQGDVPGDNTRYVGLRKLEEYLEREVPRLVTAMHLQTKVNQNPDAIITSDKTWMARIAKPAVRRTREAPPPTPMTLLNLSQQIMRSAIEGDRTTMGAQFDMARMANVKEGEQFAETATHIASPFGPDYFETECGIKVRGARIIEFFAPRANAQLLGSEGDILRIQLNQSAASVLLKFQGNVGTVVPALRGFITALTFDDGELVDVAYEPSANSARWEAYKQREVELRELRAVAASSSRHQRFRLDREDGLMVAKRMQYAKSVDPTFAVYAAYAYYDLQAIQRIQEMARYMRDDVGVVLFDLALLSRALLNRQIRTDDLIVPFFPLLSQGWALLRAHRVALHSALKGLEHHMRDSHWSLFDEVGLRMLRNAMETMDVL